MRTTIPSLTPSAALYAALAGAFVLTMIAAQPKAIASGVVAHDFVGAERCRSCHVEEYEAWRNGPHARAMEALGERERNDPRCKQCHTMVPSDPDPVLAGIQCETCHGPGKWYSTDWAMRDAELRELQGFAKPDAKTCARCHTDSTPSIEPFVYEQKLEKIRHWSLAGPAGG
jgi:hypothetical protein